MKEIALRLKQIRENAGLKQKDMANLLGIKLPGYNRIEKGYVHLTLKHVIAIQQRFKISLDWLITGKEYVQIDLESFGDYTGVVRQMLKSMKEVPGFLHGILGYFHQLQENIKAVYRSRGLKDQQTGSGLNSKSK